MEQHEQHNDQQDRSAPMSRDTQDERHRSGKADRAASDEPVTNDDLPSTEKEIESGVNQDSTSGESFSSEPGHEAAGKTDGS